MLYLEEWRVRTRGHVICILATELRKREHAHMPRVREDTMFATRSHFQVAPVRRCPLQSYPLFKVAYDALKVAGHVAA